MTGHRRPNKRPRPQQVDSQLGPVIGDYTQAQEPMQLRVPRKRFDGVQAIKNALFAASGIILVGLVLFAIFMLAMAASSRRAHAAECALQTMTSQQLGAALRAARGTVAEAIREIEHPDIEPTTLRARDGDKRKVLVGRLSRNLGLIDRLLRCDEFNE